MKFGGQRICLHDDLGYVADQQERRLLRAVFR
jgi:hypothetical protein